MALIDGNEPTNTGETTEPTHNTDSSWYESLGDDFAESKDALSTYGSLNEFVKASLDNKGKLDEYQTLPEKYDFSGDDIPEETAATLDEFAKELRLTGKQAEIFKGLYVKQQEQALEEHNASVEKLEQESQENYEKSLNELKKDWGENFEKNQAMVNKLINTFATKGDDLERLGAFFTARLRDVETGALYVPGDFAPLVRLLHGPALKMSEDSFVTDGSGVQAKERTRTSSGRPIFDSYNNMN